MEIWKDVKGYETLYMVSNLGRIKSVYHKTEKILKDRFDGKKKYKQACLYLNKNAKYFLLHRLIAQAFIPLISGKDIVNHKNGIKTDNSVENLEWCTQSENHKHAWATGLKVNTENKRLATVNFNKKTKSKIVYDVVSGITYKSLTDAAIAHKIPICTLSAKLNGNLKNNTSLIYKGKLL